MSWLHNQVKTFIWTRVNHGRQRHSCGLVVQPKNEQASFGRGLGVPRVEHRSSRAKGFGCRIPAGLRVRVLRFLDSSSTACELKRARALGTRFLERLAGDHFVAVGG